MENIIVYYGLIILSAAIVLTAQFKINSNYKKYRVVETSKGLSGQEVARKILDAAGLENIYIVETNGELTDHYDPRRKVVRLSKSIFHDSTIASAAVAAHECGHAIQDKEGYTFMKIRSMLVPVVNLISYLGYFGLVISIFAGITGYIKLSILILTASVVFQLVTLPVEFDASKRGLQQLKDLNLIEDTEQTGATKMLSAAAMTYVASLVSTLLDILRLVLILGNRNND